MPKKHFLRNRPRVRVSAFHVHIDGSLSLGSTWWGPLLSWTSWSPEPCGQQHTHLGGGSNRPRECPPPTCRRWPATQQGAVWEGTGAPPPSRIRAIPSHPHSTGSMWGGPSWAFYTPRCEAHGGFSANMPSSARTKGVLKDQDQPRLQCVVGGRQ